MFPYSRSSWDSGPEMAVASRRWIGPADSWRGDGRWFSIERVISRPSPTGEQKGWQSTFQSHRAATGAGRQGGRAGRWQAEKFHFPLGRLSPKNQTQKKRIREKKKKKREKKWTDHGRHSGEKWRDAAGSPRLRAPIRALRRPAK